MPPDLDLKNRKRQVIRHVLRDGTHEIRAGLMVLAPAGLWLAHLRGWPSYDSLLGVVAAALILLVAGPGVSRLRARLVFPRLGYARHTESTDLVALAGVTLIMVSAASAWLDSTGSLAWGSALPAIVLPLALGMLAGNSSLGRHYLMALILAAIGAALLVMRPDPFVLLTGMLVATSLLLTVGGAAALRALVVNHPPIDVDGSDDEPR